MTNLLAIVGSFRKGKSTDTLIDRTIEGAEYKNRDLNVKKIYLSDYNINPCMGCLVCRDSKKEDPYARCVIRDDMDVLNKDILESDYLVFGTPLHMGHPTALMFTFLERIIWVFGKPERNVLTIKGCPLPRSNKKRRCVTIITNSIVPPVYRIFCDNASSVINVTAKDALNAKCSGTLYAGDIEHRGVEYYLNKAYKLGTKL